MGHVKILIVEDEVIVARDIQSQLTELGYICIGHATNGEDGIALVGRLHPELVLMDINLTGAMDGIVAAQIIRDQFFVPVVFMTAFSAEAIIARAKLTEPYGYLLKPFSQRELQTVIEMAHYKHQTEVTLHENARELRALSQRIVQIQEAERRRLAIELHDEVGQSLTALKINLESSRHFKNQNPEAVSAENLEIVVDVLQKVRQMAVSLRPSMLDELGLGPALRWAANEAARRSGFALNLDVEDAQPYGRLHPDLEISIFRITQEALTNIARHAQAQLVSISLLNDGKSVTLSILDDGVGFDEAIARAKSMEGNSMGLLGMQERALLSGCHLAIESQPGQGCTLQLSCPFRGTEDCV